MVPEMQDFVDSLCQCFGTNIPGSQSNSRQQNGSMGVASSDVKTRSHSSLLPEKQLEALKNTSKRVSCCNGVGVDGGHGPAGAISDQAIVFPKTRQGSSRSARKLHKSNSQNPTSSSNNNGGNITPPSRSHSSTSHKRRRSTGSRDNIFRSKSRSDSGLSSNTSGAANTPVNPFSRFLSNHPVIMNSLCFATPVKGDSADDNGRCGGDGGGAPVDAQSVISACDDEEDDNNTMTSTVFYETTKLAGLRQTNPPMPLFNHFAVEESDDINLIVSSHSHSSAKLADMFLNFHNSVRQQQQRQFHSERIGANSDDHVMTEVATTKSNKVVVGRNGRHQRLMLDDDNIPPPMTKCSSDSKSSKSSGGGNSNGR